MARCMFAKVSDKEFRLVEKTDNLYSKLPRGTYALGFDAVKQQYFLTLLPTKPLPARIYGDIIAKSERIMTTYVDRAASTGVLLDGEKGSGKTLLARCISALAHDRHDMPTVLVADKVSGGAFNRLLAAIAQPIVLVFEEFEKIYDFDNDDGEEDADDNYDAYYEDGEEMVYDYDGYDEYDAIADKAQSGLLSLFDGMFTPEAKRLIIFTCNASTRLNAGLLNRPSRVFYCIRFRGMSDDAVREYCKENLNNAAHIDGVVTITGAFPNFNFDMLQCLVEEMNRYKEEAHQAVKDMSIRSDFAEPYNVIELQLATDLEQVSMDRHFDGARVAFPFNGPWSIPVAKENSASGSDCEDIDDWGAHGKNWIDVQFSSEDLKCIGPQSRMTFINSNGDRAVLEKAVSATQDPLQLFLKTAMMNRAAMEVRGAADSAAQA